MEHELEQVGTYVPLIDSGITEDKDEGEGGVHNTKLQLEDDFAPQRSHRKNKKTQPENESGTDSDDEEEELLKKTKRDTYEKEGGSNEEGDNLEGSERSSLMRGDRKRVKPKKRVSWVDLERGKPSAVTQVYPVDSPLYYDRRPAPMRREQRLLTAETKMDKLLIMIIIALIVVILVSFGVFVALMLTGILKRESGATN